MCIHIYKYIAIMQCLLQPVYHISKKQLPPFVNKTSLLIWQLEYYSTLPALFNGQGQCPGS